ncbi:MAG: hypothetical protein Q7K16_01245 [Candidatus Azambacteria bacterium]|nr:hypothetical protein [Candidatus Azambacteria bacterium]
MAVTSNINDKKMEDLQGLLAIEIQKVSDLLKENLELESKLEHLKNQCETWRRYYEKSNKSNKILCNREEAMAISARASTPE